MFSPLIAIGIFVFIKVRHGRNGDGRNEFLKKLLETEEVDTTAGGDVEIGDYQTNVDKSVFNLEFNNYKIVKELSM